MVSIHNLQFCKYYIFNYHIIMWNFPLISYIFKSIFSAFDAHSMHRLHTILSLKVCAVALSKMH